MTPISTMEIVDIEHDHVHLPLPKLWATEMIRAVILSVPSRRLAGGDQPSTRPLGGQPCLSVEGPAQPGPGWEPSEGVTSI